mgnify:FL=1
MRAHDDGFVDDFVFLNRISVLRCGSWRSEWLFGLDVVFFALPRIDEAHRAVAEFGGERHCFGAILSTRTLFVEGLCPHCIVLDSHGILGRIYSAEG